MNPATPEILVLWLERGMSLLTGDDLLRRFWEAEEKLGSEICLMLEKALLDHFKNQHTCSEDGRFMVPLPKKSAWRTSVTCSPKIHLIFERSLHLKGQFRLKTVIDEYFDFGHAESVPESDLQKSPHSVFHLMQ